MTEDRPPPSLEEIEARLREARRGAGLEPSESPVGSGGASHSDMGLGLRIAVELVAGVFVGVAIGYGLDRWLDSAPWGLIVMTLVGAVAGFMNVYRVVNGQGYAAGFKKTGDTRNHGE